MKNSTRYMTLFVAVHLCVICLVNAVEKSKLYVSGNYSFGLDGRLSYEELADHSAYRVTRANAPGLSIGYSITKNIRAELGYDGLYDVEYKHSFSAPKDNTEVKVTFQQRRESSSVFVNTYFDISETNNCKPFVLFGVGLGRNKSGTMHIKTQVYNVNGPIYHHEDNQLEEKRGSRKNSLAWKLGVGLNYLLSNKIALNLVSYQYIDLGKSQTQPDGDGDILVNRLRIHSINTGIMFKFQL